MSDVIIHFKVFLFQLFLAASCQNKLQRGRAVLPHRRSGQSQRDLCGKSQNISCSAGEWSCGLITRDIGQSGLNTIGVSHALRTWHVHQLWTRLCSKHAFRYFKENVVCCVEWKNYFYFLIFCQSSSRVSQ